MKLLSQIVRHLKDCSSTWSRTFQYREGLSGNYLWKTNMEPKNGGLEDDFAFQRDDFLGSMLVFRVAL